MKKRFENLWHRIGAKTDSAAVFKQITEYYCHPNRFYHNLKHIQWCLDKFDEVQKLSGNSDAVETAIWYHDIIYDVKKSYNEQQSADLAVDVCKKAGLEEGFTNEVYNLIIATKHNTISKTINEKLICDIDLSILSADNDEFELYEKGIRMEYSDVEEEEFRKARAAILKQFLSRETIFNISYFRDKYESKARKNLAESIRKLLTKVI